MVSESTSPRPWQRWSTDHVESRHALAYWVDTICKSFLEIDIESPQRHHFRGRLDQFELGPSCIEARGCVLIDCSAPYRLECLPTTRSVALRIPDAWLRNWIPAPESLAGRPLPRGRVEPRHGG